jgi:hypothetical protein
MVRKKLGLDLRSEKVDGDRVYRIVPSGGAGSVSRGSHLCVPRTSPGVLKVRSGNIGDEGRQEQVVK